MEPKLKKANKTLEELSPLVANAHFAMCPLSYQQRGMQVKGELQKLSERFQKALDNEEPKAPVTQLDQHVAEATAIIILIKKLYKTFAAFV